MKFFYNIIVVCLWTCWFSWFGMQALQAQQTQQTPALLDQYRKEALEYNQDLKSVRKQMEVAQYLEKSARTENLPSVSIGGEAAYKSNPLSADLDLAGLGSYHISSEKAVYGLNATVVQPVYYGGAISALKEKSASYTDLMKSQEALTRTDIIERTARLYWKAVAQQEVVDVTEQYVRSLKDLVEVIYERVDAGLLGKTDLLTVEVKLNSVEYLLKQNENNFEVSRLSLNSFLGKSLDENLPMASKVVAITVMPEVNDLLKEAIHKRPEIKIADEQVKMKSAEARMKIAHYNPQVAVGASATYGTPGPNLTDGKPNDNFSAFVKVSIPIFEWGQRGYEKHAANLQTEIAQEQLSKTQDQVTLQIQASYYSYQQAVTQVVLSASSMDKAKENLQLMQDRYDHGESSITDLIAAQIYLQDLLMNNIQARLEAQWSKTAFHKAVGDL